MFHHPAVLATRYVEVSEGFENAEACIAQHPVF
jgi:hypothetical protein